jgi:hypothetical protein
MTHRRCYHHDAFPEGKAARIPPGVMNCEKVRSFYLGVLTCGQFCCAMLTQVASMMSLEFGLKMVNCVFTVSE